MDADEGGEFHRTGNFWKAAQLFWCGFFPHYVGDDVFLRGYDLLASHRIRHDSGGGESVLRRKRSNGRDNFLGNIDGALFVGLHHIVFCIAH